MSAISKLDVSSGLPQMLLEQPFQTKGLGPNNCNALIVSMRKVDSAWVVASRYGDDVWWPTGSTTNTAKCRTKLDFTIVVEAFRDQAKAILYRLLRRGRNGQGRPSASSLIKTLSGIKLFLGYVHSLGMSRLSDVTPLLCSSYAHACRDLLNVRGMHGKSQLQGAEKRLSLSAIYHRLKAVEAIHELSQYTDDPMLAHPWPETSADHLSGVGAERRSDESKKTPLIPDEVFTTIFQRAWGIVQSADRLLDLRDEMGKVDIECKEFHRGYVPRRKNQALEGLGWEGGYHKFQNDITNIRTACYIVVASLSGCRNHELGFLRLDACYRTKDDSGERYWWMRSKSTKTGEGDTQWMVPEAAVTALRIMERWAAPFQIMLKQQIENYRSRDPSDVRIAEANEHLGAIFVGAARANNNEVRTLSVNQWNFRLRAFVKECGLDWNLASHQFRRKFANYAARSRFGDLRYLKEHFKHWSLDMTLGYALNEAQEMELYLEIEDELQDIRDQVVGGWLHRDEPLGGGYGKNIIAWRSRDENIVLFRSRADMVRSIAQSTAVRSNGHAWCTTDSHDCDGNSLDPTRCGDGCTNSVIGKQHVTFYQGLYDGLRELEESPDIGEGGGACQGSCRLSHAANG